MKAINHAFLKVFCKRYLLTASIVMSCRRCLAFVCAKLLQTELDKFVSHWNSHLIRPNRNADSPSGYPDDMYDMPETFGQYNFITINNYNYIGMLHSSMLNAYNIVGAEECMKDVEAALWQQAVREE